MRRALFVRHLALGDILLSFPVIREFKLANPETKIDFYTLLPEIAKLSPDVDTVIDIREKRFSEIKKNYDTVFFLSYEYTAQLHYTDGYSISTGIRTENKKIRINIPLEYKRKAEKLLAGKITGKRLIGVQETSRSIFRNYPLHEFQIIINKIKEKYSDVEFVTISDTKNKLENCINLSGSLSLGTAIGLISVCDFFLTIDSGFLHIAQALGLPSTAIFGCTLPELVLTSPENSQIVMNGSISCIGCFHERNPGEETLTGCKRGDIACMNQLPAEQTIRVVSRMLENKKDPDLEKRISRYEIIRKNSFGKMDLIGTREKMELIGAEKLIRLSEESSNPIRQSAEKIFAALKKGEWGRFIARAGRIFRK